MNKNKESELYDLIEEFGFFLERSGYPPSAARVYALLMIWEPSELHFDQIQELLKLSKGATSKAVNSLIVMDRVEVITKHGVRKKYYRIKVKPGVESAGKFLLYLETMKRYLQRIEQLKDERGFQGLRFQEEIDFLDKLTTQLRPLIM